MNIRDSYKAIQIGYAWDRVSEFTRVLNSSPMMVQMQVIGQVYGGFRSEILSDVSAILLHLTIGMAMRIVTFYLKDKK